MSESQNFMVYDIEESGEHKKLDFEQEFLEDYLQPDKTFIIVRIDLNRIYLWKGARSTVRKRFIGSKIATEVQAELKEQGLPYCKIVSIDQGDEIEEFLNVFGLESMEVTEKLEDMKYYREAERLKLEKVQIFAKQEDLLKKSKLDEIRDLLDEGENILWIKNSTLKLEKNWIKTFSKDKKYKGRFKKTENADEIELKKYEIRYVITDKKIISSNILNRIYDFSNIPRNIFRIKKGIVILDLKGIRTFEIEGLNGIFNVWFNTEGDGVFLIEDLTLEEYENLIFIFTVIMPFRAEIPKNLKLKYIRKGTYR
ncbi:MAG: hypothetical protein ACFFAH_05760 [Promethearchaeota archaeon]